VEVHKTEADGWKNHRTQVTSGKQRQEGRGINKGRLEALWREKLKNGGRRWKEEFPRRSS